MAHVIQKGSGFRVLGLGCVGSRRYNRRVSDEELSVSVLGRIPKPMNPTPSNQNPKPPNSKLETLKVQSWG